MRRFVALAMIAALVSVSSLPLLPASVICAVAAGRMDDHAVAMQTGTGYGMHHDASLHQHNRRLTPAGKKCCIECGDGCHASLDGLPHQLAPHALAPAPELALPLAVIKPAPLIPWTESLKVAPLPPPPKLFSSELS